MVTLPASFEPDLPEVAVTILGIRQARQASKYLPGSGSQNKNVVVEVVVVVFVVVVVDDDDDDDDDDDVALLWLSHD